MLPPDEARRVEEHVGACRDCQRVIEQLIGSVPGALVPLAGGRENRRAKLTELPGFAVLGWHDADEISVVWRVRELESRRTLALKVMRAEASTDPGAVERFLGAAQLTALLTHPAIAPVHAIGKLADGRPYCTMKLVEGETLAALLQRRTDSAEQQSELVGIFAKVCQAVAYAHKRGAIHRNLNPSSVVVGEFGEVLVTGWGGQSELSSGPQYAPPEQIRGERELLDTRCDVFALGAMLYEVLTGAPPVSAAPGEEEPRQAAAGDLTRAGSELNRWADTELARVARQCLAPNRADRLPDAGAVAAAVVSYQANVEQRLRRAERECAEAKAQARRERLRRRVAVGLIAVLVLVVVALVSLLYGA